jgi:CRP-like cAMP-binding protein
VRQGGNSVVGDVVWDRVYVAESVPHAYIPMLEFSCSTKNRILGAITLESRERVDQSLTPVHLRRDMVLHECGEPSRYLYFPIDSIVSLLYILGDGAPAEIAMIGNEGVVGVELFMGGETTTSRAVVQSSGLAYRLPARSLKEEFDRHGSMFRALLRYAQSLLTQTSLTAVCNRHHSVDQQLCRWLLLSLDRLSSADLRVTQELIANLLGVRREGITEAAGRLQKSGAIRYCHGKIHILDRVKLERMCCECYSIAKTESDRLLPPCH